MSIHWRQLIAAVHKAGHADLNAIRAAILENDGKISVIPKQN
jgi:uncharacterized membrane protein YcaP (DUF421 family)